MGVDSEGQKLLKAKQDTPPTWRCGRSFAVLAEFRVRERERESYSQVGSAVLPEERSRAEHTHSLCLTLAAELRPSRRSYRISLEPGGAVFMR